MPSFSRLARSLVPTALLLLTALPRSLIAQSTASVSSVDGQLPFVWYFDTQSDFTIARCSTIDFTLQPNTAAGSPEPVPPYTAIFYPIGGQPIVIPVPGGPDKNTTTLRWRAALPVTTKIFFQFVDSQGQSGGVAPLYNIVDGDTCPTTYVTNSNINLTLDPASNPQTCQTINVGIAGGVAPYVISVVRASFTTLNETVTGQSGSWVNSITGGGSLAFVVSDSRGAYSLTSPIIFSQGGSNNACLSGDSPNDTPGSRPGRHMSGSDSNIGTIVGATLGSLVGILAIALILLSLLYRRRVRQAREAGEPSPTGFAVLRRPRRQSNRSDRSTDKFAQYAPGGSDRPPRYSDRIHGAGIRRTTDDGSVHSMQNIEPIRRFRITNPDADQSSTYQGHDGAEHYEHSSDEGDEVLRENVAGVGAGGKQERELNW